MSDKQVFIPAVLCILVVGWSLAFHMSYGLEPFGPLNLPAWCRWIFGAGFTVAACVHIWRGRFDA
jgi:hypothetical protein